MVVLEQQLRFTREILNMPDSTISQRRPERSARLDLVGYLAVLVAAASWGTSGIWVKFIVVDADFSALALAFWRDLLTFLALLTGVGVLRPTWLHVQRRNLPWLIAMGGSLGAFHVFWNLAVLINGAAVATVQQAAMPAIVAVVARLIWCEPLTRNKILAILLTFTGTVFVSGLDLLGQTTLTLPGFLIGLGLPLTYASWSLFGKKVRQHYNPLITLTYAFAFGAIVLLPFQFFTPQPWPIPPFTWIWFVGLISVATILAFSAYTFGLGKLPASITSILAMSEIAFVAVYAYFLLGERLTASQIFGTLLVISGVLLLIWRRQTRSKKR
jgi:drug/metabolite transporter (DMT)-like permease